MTYLCFYFSGEPAALGLHEVAHNADLHAHARFEGRDTGRSLRKLPRAVYLADIAARHAGARVIISISLVYRNKLIGVPKL